MLFSVETRATNLGKIAMTHFFSSSTQPHVPSTMPLRRQSPFQVAQFSSRCLKAKNGCTSIGACGASCSKPLVCCAVHMASGQSGEPEKLNFENLMNKVRKAWDSSPQPIKDFPWNRAFDNFIQLVLDLIVSVIKYLCAPVLAVSSISEMSYCAHERKLSLVPFPLVIGIAITGILQVTALEISPRLKDAEVPWHLIAIAIFFTLLKLPGPYYPYWGRVLIPHFANGVLWRTLWSMFFWHKRPRIEPGTHPERTTIHLACAYQD